MPVRKIDFKLNPIPLIRNIGATVRRRRTALGITQNELAEQAGVSERLVRSLEMGTAYRIGLEKLISIIEPLGLSLNVTSAENEDEGQDKEQNAISQGAEYSYALKQVIASWPSAPSTLYNKEQQ